MGEVGVASAVWAGSADGDEHDVGSAHCFGKLGGEGEIARRSIARHQAVEPGLVNGIAAGAQAGDLVRVLVEAGHMMAEIGKTRARNEPDITAPDHYDTHYALLPFYMKEIGRAKV